VNLNDKFIPGAIIDFVKQAELDSRNPYFLCLDEMNLARVEYYLSDILSIIETREYVDGKVTTDPLITENYYGADITAKGKYGVVRIPENLYIIGTVNMDETTFPFSRKVLDRANTIEFSTVELLANFDSTQGEVKAIFADNTFMKADYVFFNQCASDKDFVEDVCIELQDINKILEKANAHVGYRVRDEIVFYMLNNKNAGNLLTRNQAFDHEIMQKILPRIQGSSASVKIMLCELFKYCAGDYESYQTESDDVSAKMMAAANKETCKYKESAKKIAFMVRRFEEDGFTAYWL
jgi:5-methylcytosine-specific restriction protein B